MRSSLTEWSASGVHVFGKWMSERVVQQGGLPRGRICFALLGGFPAQQMRVQGWEFGLGDLLLLRGGEEFEFHRPAGVELLRSRSMRRRCRNTSTQRGHRMLKESRV